MTDTDFQQLMAEVTASTGRFGHREHIHLTWLAVHRHRMPTAISLISNGIRQTARYAGAPQKYNATVSRAWVELVAHHTHHDGDADFDTFLARNPALLNKRLITRFYHPATLATAQARTGWTPPDRAPFPWLPTT